MKYVSPLVAFFVVILGYVCSSGAAADQAQTIKDLQAAYNGESNAQMKYRAFAEKADQEGYRQAASLFRAAARAEAIHAANHAQVLKTLGVQAQADLQTPQVGTTAANLKAAIEGESYERDTMYPQFIGHARQARLAQAVRTFNLARTAESEHAKLYQATLDSLEQGKSQAEQFYVCTVCGFTARTVGGKCPSCFSPRDKFIVVE